MPVDRGKEAGARSWGHAVNLEDRSFSSEDRLPSPSSGNGPVLTRPEPGTQVPRSRLGLREALSRSSHAVFLQKPCPPSPCSGLDT